MIRSILAVLADDGAATMVEYAIVLALLSAVAITGMEAASGAAGAQLGDDQTNLSTAQTAP